MEMPKWFMDAKSEVDLQRRFLRENERIEITSLTKIDANSSFAVCIRIQSVVFDGESNRFKNNNNTFHINASSQSEHIQSELGEQIRRMVYYIRDEIF